MTLVPKAPTTKAAFLVTGHTGSYEMSHTWPVALCPTRSEAETLRAQAQAVSDQIIADASGYLDLADSAHGLNPFDPNMHFVDDSTIHYGITHVPSLASLPDLAAALAAARATFASRLATPELDLPA